MAGPLAGDSGAIIVFDVSSGTELDDLMATGPYFTTPASPSARCVTGHASLVDA
jgi:hypothetical protein